MKAAMRRKLAIWLAVGAGLTLIVAANWQLVDLAVSSDPGCVSVDASQSAAKHAC